MFSSYAKREWLTVIAIGLMLSGTFAVLGHGWLALLALLAAAAVLSFFRDPERRPPTQRGAVVAPADGRVSSIHEVEHFEPFDGPAVCVRIFLSVLNVHVNRSPCHGIVQSITHRPGQYLNALNPESAEANEAVLMVLVHPFQGHPIAAVRQVAGMLARTIVCAAHIDETLQRGQRYGIIKLGSTTELYLPLAHNPQILVNVGAKVHGGVTVLANVNPQRSGPAREDQPSAESENTLPAEAAPQPESPAEASSASSEDTGRQSSLFSAAAPLPPTPPPPQG